VRLSTEHGLKTKKKMDNQLDFEEAERLGGLFFTENEIAIILTEHPENWQTASLRGRLLQDAKIRKMVIEQATQGSNEAQKLVEQWKMKIAIEAAK
jgi:hypothetical protein